ncbi:MAG: DUF1269 domain-containing protein [Eggerthellaceae bacterium]|nr:DUF1269 domain-containing protein [Eggerthellaceae bacterium]
MSENVVIAVFEDEAEATHAYDGVFGVPEGEGYTVAEAALIKNNGYSIEVLRGFGIGEDEDHMRKGIVIGSLVGLLGGPIGIILGAQIGARKGAIIDAANAVDNASVVAVIASRIYEGEIAIAALVSEDEPAFDFAFEGYNATIVRYDAADIADDVDRLIELETAVCEQMFEQIDADVQAEREERREERRARIKAQLEEYSAATNRAMGYE